MKVKIATLGCKVNQYESQEILCLLQKDGFEATGTQEADVYIVNSCTVTAESSRKTRQTIHKLRKEHPDAVLVLTGCYPQAFPEEAAACPADIVTGNKSNLLLPQYIAAFLKDRQRILAVSQHCSGEPYCACTITAFEGHTRAFVKIQDGCNRFCSYCIIPTARGRSRSRTIADIRTQLLTLAAKGFREVVFTGINLSAYGRECGLTLADAVDAAAETEGIARIRLGSLEPDHITDDLLAHFAACRKFCPQFHLSLQSGSDAVLQKMNRHYTSAEYAALCNKIRSLFPEATITTDIITGFPGETEEDFQQTIAFVERIGFEKVHIFPYSERSGTRAVSFPGRVNKKEREERAHRLAAVCTSIREEFLRRQNEKTVLVLFETPQNGLQNGFTANYTPVCVQTERQLTGLLLPVRITGTGEDCCLGIPEDTSP